MFGSIFAALAREVGVTGASVGALASPVRWE